MIDFHTHPVMIEEMIAEDPGISTAVRDVFGLYVNPQPLATFLLQLEAGGASEGVILPVDCTTAHGCRIVSNDQIAELVRANPNLVGFASVDPRDPHAAQELQRAIQDLKLAGLKLDPALQRFYPDDRGRAYPLYRLCQEMNVPVMIHCGLSWAPKGLAKYAKPLLLEEVVQSFPELRVIIPHLGWPWVDDAVALALKYHNVYLDTSVVYSGAPAESLRHLLIDRVGKGVLERSLRNQLLFGSNYPRVDVKRASEAVRELGLSPSLEDLIFEGSALRVLGKGASAS